MTTRPEGMSLPAGNRTGPNCGVTAVAAFTGVSFDRVWKLIAPRKGPGWRGTTYPHDRAAALKALGADTVTVKMARVRLQTLVNRLPWGRTFMVHTTGHVQVVRNGIVMDQGGPAPIAEYRFRRDICRTLTSHKDTSL